MPNLPFMSVVKRPRHERTKEGDALPHVARSQLPRIDSSSNSMAMQQSLTSGFMRYIASFLPLH